MAKWLCVQSVCGFFLVSLKVPLRLGHIFLCLVMPRTWCRFAGGGGGSPTLLLFSQFPTPSVSPASLIIDEMVSIISDAGKGTDGKTRL